MKKVLKRVSPESRGVSSARAEQLLKELNSLGNEVHGFLLSVGGEVICESFAAPYAPNIPHSCHSLGKSYTAAGIQKRGIEYEQNRDLETVRRCRERGRSQRSEDQQHADDFSYSKHWQVLQLQCASESVF